MLRSSRSRLLSLVGLTSMVTASVLIACAASDDTTPTGGADAGAEGSTTGKDGATTETDDATVDAGKDGAKDATPGKDANGPGADGDPCTYNRECQTALRCECDETTGCACKPGARGTGKNGIDACDSGNQCASSVCVEGQTTDEYYCSDECTDATDCEAKLPKCLQIVVFPTPICVREPPK